MACVLTNSFQVGTAVPGIWFAGAALVSLPTIARGTEPRTYLAQLRRLCRSAGSEMLLLEERYARLLPDDTDHEVPIVTYESLDSSRSLSPAPPDRDDVVMIQYSSGSTSEPKGCELTARAIQRQLEILREFADVDPKRDRGVMWLPLSHDMGLFGGLLQAWTTGMAGFLSRPERFLTSPRSWFDDCAAFGATTTSGPPSALAAAARAARHAPPSGPLLLRNCNLGGERIEAGVLRDAQAAFGPSGMAPSVPTPAYGLAEATLAVTSSDIQAEPRTIPVDARALLRGELRPPQNGGTPYEVVSCGSPLTGIEVRIDGEVGEICVRSPCLAEGYFGDEAQTRATFKDGELRTGDWGFVDNEELFVVGRLDDMIAVGGRNVYVSSVEAAITREVPVRPGNCAIVDVPLHGRSALVMLAEPAKGEELELRAIAREAKRIAAATGGLTLNECVFVPHGAFPKTPSGKLQRFRCRELILNEHPVTERIALS